MFTFLLITLVSLNLNSADCLIEKDSTEITKTEEGYVSTYRLLKLKILNTRGRDRCGDIRVRYNKKSQKFHIINAYTLLPDGKKVPVEKDAIMDVGSPEAAIAPEYTQRIIKAVSFPALQKDAEIVYEYKIESKKKDKEPLFGTVFFKGQNPIKKKVFIIKVPEEEHIYFKKVNGGNINIHVDTTKEGISYVFMAEDVERLPREDFLPSMREIAPFIDYTEFKNKDDMAAYIYSKFKDKIETGKEIKKLASKLWDKDPEKTFYNIIKYVQENIQNINLFLWDAGIEPHKASWTLKHKYGDVRDKTVLALSLMKASGISGDILLVEGRRGSYYASVGLSSVLSLAKTEQLPVLSHYTTMIIRAHIKDTTLYASVMDKYSNVRYLPSSLQHRPCFSFMNGKGNYFRTPLYPEKDNTLKMNLEGKLNKDGSFKGTCHIKAKGSYAATLRERFRFKKQKEIKIMLDDLVSAFGEGSKMDSFKLYNIKSRENLPELVVYITSPNFANVNNTIQFTLPSTFFTMRYASTKDRKLPLWLGVPRTIEYNANIRFVENASPFVLPDSVRLKGEYNEVESNMAFSNNTLSFHSLYSIHAQEVPKEGYANFRKIEGIFYSRNQRSVILNAK